MQGLAEILKHVQFVEKYVTWKIGTAIPGEILFLHNSLDLLIFSSPSGLDVCDLNYLIDITTKLQISHAIVLAWNIASEALELKSKQLSKERFFFSMRSLKTKKQTPYSQITYGLITILRSAYLLALLVPMMHRQRAILAQSLFAWIENLILREILGRN